MGISHFFKMFYNLNDQKNKESDRHLIKFGVMKYLCVILEHLGKVTTLPSLPVIAFQLVKYGRRIL